MRKFLIIGVCIAGFAFLGATQYASHCGHHEEVSPQGGHHEEVLPQGGHHEEALHHFEFYPKWLKDAKIEVTNVDVGAMVKITAANPAMVKKIQEFAPKLAEYMKTGKCPFHEKAHEEAKEVEKVKDPVCGMEIEKEKALSAEYEGKTYYFCAQSCKDKFLKAPATYIGEKTQEGR